MLEEERNMYENCHVNWEEDKNEKKKESQGWRTQTPHGSVRNLHSSRWVKGYKTHDCWILKKEIENYI